MKSIRPASPVLLVALAVAALLLACGGDEKEPTAPATSPAPSAAKIAEPSDGKAPSGNAGTPSEQLRVKVELPDYYPADAPVYPGSSTSQTSKDGKGRVTVMFGTEDTAFQVMDYMVATLPDEGWTLILQQEVATGLLLQATKGNRLINVLVSNLDEGKDTAITMVAVSVDS